MKLYEAIATLRAQVDDSGLFLTSYGAAASVANAQTIPVAELAMIAVGGYVRIGSEDAAEGAIVTAKSADTGAGTATLSAPLKFAHAAQSPIASALVSDADYIRYLAQAIKHVSTFRPLSKRTTLELLAGVDVYNLPADFATVDRESFDEAIGAESTMRTHGTYYSLLYANSVAFSANGWGAGSTYAATYPLGMAPVYGDPLTNPNTGQGPAGSTEYRFIRANPPQLVVTPAPVADRTLTFFYGAAHTMPTATVDSTLADEDTHLVILYAQHLTCLALSTGACQVMKYELEGEKIDKSKAPQEYRAIADSALSKFDEETRFRPLGVRG